MGIFGYHYTAGISWLDSLHNASMILSGMGPVVNIETVSGKLFSSFYALFSGVIFITNIGVILAPAIHRFFHRMHVPPANDRIIKRLFDFFKNNLFIFFFYHKSKKIASGSVFIRWEICFIQF